MVLPSAECNAWREMFGTAVQRLMDIGALIRQITTSQHVIPSLRGISSRRFVPFIRPGATR
jgi:hypothetical protein